MTLKEKFSDVQEAYHDRSDDYVRVANDFAIGFAEWTWNRELITINDCDYFEYKFNLYTRKELLKIYKKEKAL